MGLFDERIAYKPFEYPEYYTEGWLKQAQAFWLHTEISMQSDIKDWKEKLNDKEKNLVGNILLGFAQTECAVSDYWTQKVVGWFPKHEIQQMAMMFGSQETVHAVAYSYLKKKSKKNTANDPGITIFCSGIYTSMELYRTNTDISKTLLFLVRTFEYLAAILIHIGTYVHNFHHVRKRRKKKEKRWFWLKKSKQNLKLSEIRTISSLNSILSKVFLDHTFSRTYQREALQCKELNIYY